MEREEKNPYVTQIELERESKRLSEKIQYVDEKHTTNYGNLAKVLAVSQETNKNIVSSNNRLSRSFDNFSTELKDELKQNRQSHQELREKVGNHDTQLKDHNKFILKQQEIADSKKGQLLKWVVGLSAIFVAIIGGIFSIVEVIIPYLLEGR